MQIEKVSINDLDQIMNIEHAGFNDAEAGSRDSYIERIQILSDSFLIAKEADKVLGFVVGPITNERYIEDWMFEKATSPVKNNGHQLIFSIAIDPTYRGQGIGSKLLSAFEKNAKALNCVSVSLTCLEDRIKFYEKNGYQNKGLAESTHGNETWYNMEKLLD
ncbi:GNAT family N-acetyltransferase [Companilactobacillus mishanensis]|uniref:GNAT family N-acetyltransferase n=1 Tax=Companilactobacillus mishanensis TaxID=2486008 RepID=UPI0012976163|nr:GNAT family N-acetyltransferase [Companilactobacillus mishanensis]MQS90208.1 GNAT family N-acetyltransferase [Companilactobacillus mishanensis]